MRLGVLFSGGKDSSYALLKAEEAEDVVCLITVVSKNAESYMYHTPNIDITKLQAKAMGLPIVQRISEGKKDTEVADLKKAIAEAVKKYRIEGVVTGAIESVYQSERIQKVCDELGVFCFNPLWLKDQKKLLYELVEKKFKVIITGIFAYPLNEKWLGREIDSAIIEELGRLNETYKLSPAGEGGEIETAVLDAPYFKKRIEVCSYENRVKDNSGVMEIKKARLVDK